MHRGPHNLLVNFLLLLFFLVQFAHFCFVALYLRNYGRVLGLNSADLRVQLADAGLQRGNLLLLLVQLGAQVLNFILVQLDLTIVRLLECLELTLTQLFAHLDLNRPVALDLVILQPPTVDLAPQRLVLAAHPLKLKRKFGLLQLDPFTLPRSLPN